MNNNPLLMTHDNEEGLKKVLNKSENYAYLMESSTILYHTERKCNITQVGDLIDDKNYAIGMRKGKIDSVSSVLRTPELILILDYELRDAIAQNVLLLQEKGIIDKIRTRWWMQKRGGGACTVNPQPRFTDRFLTLLLSHAEKGIGPP